MDEDVIADREIAAAIGLVLAVAALAIGFFARLVVVAAPLGIAGFGLGLWAAARGERAVLATFAVMLGLAAVVASIIWTLTVD